MSNALAGFVVAAVAVVVGGLIGHALNSPDTSVSNGMFVCMTNGNTHIAWKTPNGRYIGNDLWQVYNPTAKAFVIYKQSSFEACAVLPIAESSNSDDKERLNIEHKKDTYEVSK